MQLETLEKAISAFLKQRKSFSTKIFRTRSEFLDLCSFPPQGEAMHKWICGFSTEHTVKSRRSRVRIFLHIFCSFLHIFSSYQTWWKRHLPVFTPNTLPCLFPLINGNTCDTYLNPKSCFNTTQHCINTQRNHFPQGDINFFLKNPSYIFIHSTLFSYILDL